MITFSRERKHSITRQCICDKKVYKQKHAFSWTITTVSFNQN